MVPTKQFLVCFALDEEARPFERGRGRHAGVAVLVTGIGRHNAEISVRKALKASQPALVLTSGFAGALDPGLSHGTVLFEGDDVAKASPLGHALIERLNVTGARPGRFYCADRIAASAAAKRALRTATGADAVEMESGAIRAVCQVVGIPCLTVRVISDEAGEDLPLDFNAFMRPGRRLDVRRILWAVVRSPRLIGPLRRLHQRSLAAACRLAEVLFAALDPGTGRRTG